MKRPVLNLWLHMTCRAWIELGRWDHVCRACTAIARPVGGTKA